MEKITCVQLTEESDMAKEMHTQCSLVRGTQRQVVWVPAGHAKRRLGKTIDLKVGDGEWEHDWIVESLGDTVP